MTYRAVIFDFGGVINNMRWDVAQQLEQEHGLEEHTIVRALYASDDWHEVQEGRGDLETWAVNAHKRLEEQAGKELPPLHMQWREAWHPIDENISLIRALKAAYKVSILSNADLSLEERIKETMDIHDLFDDIVCSAVVGTSKPKHDIFELAAERLDLPAEACVFIDDSERNVTAAREVGMAAVHFRVHEGDVLADQLSDLGVRVD